MLPYWYSELITERLKDRDSGFAAFLDLFVDRLVRLEYEACAAVSPALLFEREQWNSRFTDLLRAAIGIVPETVPTLDPRDLYSCGGLAARRPVSACVLQGILKQYLDLPVTIREFTGGMYPVPSDSRVRLGATVPALAVVGDAVFVPSAGITIEIGPVTSEQAARFWRGNIMDDWAPCRRLVEFLLGNALDFVMDLIVLPSATFGCVLWDGEQLGSHLGVNVWLRSPEPGEPSRTRIWPRQRTGGD